SHRGASRDSGLRARGEAAAPLGLLGAKDFNEVGVDVIGASWNPVFKSSRQIGADAALHFGRELVHSPQEAVEQAKFLFAELGRPDLDELGLLGFRFGP